MLAAKKKAAISLRSIGMKPPPFLTSSMILSRVIGMPWDDGYWMFS